uniref:Uncharacterized protein n=1 Tax=Vannella robusta TaxID=1487602 RepID=A0A7S4I224_9EUKA|mmetsp:Transcript_19330/g.24442  ORF Transcript_19330/g.24442 Transcript_19330/m.24442 type:complete len:258 (+) Transcript_19330:34-807(+)
MQQQSPQPVFVGVSPFELFPTTFSPLFEFFNIAGLKFFVSPRAGAPFDFRLIIKGFWNCVTSEFTVENLLTDVGCILSSFLIQLAQGSIGGRIIQRIMPQREQYHYSMGNIVLTRDVPTPSVLATKVGTFVAVRAFFYPFKTALVRLMTKQISPRSALQLFTDPASFKSLYNGFQFHLLWSVGYGALSSLEEMFFYRKVNNLATPTVALVQYFSLFLLQLPLAPVATKIIFDQANIPFEFTWNLSLFRWIRATFSRP